MAQTTLLEFTGDAVCSAEVDELEEAHPDLAEIDSVSEAREYIEQALAGPEFCGWCLTRKRDVFTEYDEALARQLSTGNTKQTFEALGNRIEPDGTVDAAEWTLLPVSDADVVHPPDARGKYVVCPGCDRTNGAAAGENRTKRQRHEHFNNLLSGFGCAFDRAAGHDAIREANRECDLDDCDVLARGFVVALSQS